MMPCPFCGSSDQVVLQCGAGIELRHAVMCVDCSTNGPLRTSGQEAVEAWGQRAGLEKITDAPKDDSREKIVLEKISGQTEKILLGLRRMSYSQRKLEKLASPLRFDGIYQSDQQVDPEENCAYWNCLRFYEDGAVLGIWTTDPIEKFVGWLRRENESASLFRGRYQIVGSTIRFSTLSSFGILDYRGIVGDRMLELEFISHTNGTRGILDFRFVSFR